MLLSNIQKLSNPKRDKTLTIDDLTKLSAGNEIISITGESESDLPFNKYKNSIFENEKKL